MKTKTAQGSGGKQRNPVAPAAEQVKILSAADSDEAVAEVHEEAEAPVVAPKSRATPVVAANPPPSTEEPLVEVMALTLINTPPVIGKYLFVEHFDIPRGELPRNSRWRVPLNVALRLSDSRQFIITGN